MENNPLAKAEKDCLHVTMFKKGYSTTLEKKVLRKESWNWTSNGVSTLSTTNSLCEAFNYQEQQKPDSSELSKPELEESSLSQSQEHLKAGLSAPYLPISAYMVLKILDTKSDVKVSGVEAG